MDIKCIFLFWARVTHFLLPDWPIVDFEGNQVRCKGSCLSWAPRAPSTLFQGNYSAVSGDPLHLFVLDYFYSEKSKIQLLDKFPKLEDFAHTGHSFISHFTRVSSKPAVRWNSGIFNSHGIFQLAVLHYCFCIVFIVLSGKFAFLSCIFDIYLLGFKLTFVRCWSNVWVLQSTCSDGIFVPPTVTTNHLILKGFAASKYLIPSNCVLVYSVAT